MSIKTLKRKLDKIFATYLKQKFPYCQHCGKKDGLQIHHIYSRKVNALRFEPDNCLVLCPACHFYFHQHPLELSDFLLKVKGKKIIEKLKKESKKLKKFTKEELEKLILKYGGEV